MPGDMGSGWGSTITIAQDATRLSVEYAIFSRYDLQPPLTLTTRSTAPWAGTR